MKPSYWHKQTTAQPLFPDMLWSRPENRAFAGKLLVVGGNAHGFAAPVEAFRSAEQAGVGVVRTLLPDAIRKYVGKTFDAGDFAPSTPSGSFAQKALAEMLDLAGWADAVLLAGDFGKNSETAILLEKFAGKYQGMLVLAGDSADYFLAAPGPVLDRPETLLALDFSQLQKPAVGAHFTHAFTSQLDFIHFIELLHDFASQYSAYLLVERLGQYFVVAEGQVSTTPANASHPLLQAASQAAVWWLQNPGKPFAAITTSLVAA